MQRLEFTLSQSMSRTFRSKDLFSTGTGNLVRSAVPVEKDLVVYVVRTAHGTCLYGRVLLLIAVMLLTLLYIHVPDCMYVFTCVHAYNTVNYVPVQLDNKQP